jgi:hypothetical protein
MLLSRGIILRLSFLSKLLISLLILALAQMLVHAEPALTADEATKMLPDSIGDFRARGPARMPSVGIFERRSPEDFRALSRAARLYVSPTGETITIDLVKTRSDSGAYALLTNEAATALPSQLIGLENIGTAGIKTASGINFFRGSAFVNIYSTSGSPNSSAGALALAGLFAQTLDKGDGDIPVLVKHLPDWEKVRERALYVITLDSLKSATGNQQLLDAVSFEGGAEAVTATYGQSRLVIIENTTPQLATDNDARIQGKIRGLREQGQNVPAAYQRVGNYSVLVFDAPDEQTAQQLIKAITYEQTVQWLGNNPRALERVQRQYTETTANIILAVLKASGLSILLCLGIGGLFGGLVFRHRRAQQAASTAYSDAGDMVRLNIDGMTAQNDPARLLGRGDG